MPAPPGARARVQGHEDSETPQQEPGRRYKVDVLENGSIVGVDHAEAAAAS